MNQQTKSIEWMQRQWYLMIVTMIFLHSWAWQHLSKNRMPLQNHYERTCTVRLSKEWCPSSSTSSQNLTSHKDLKAFGLRIDGWGPKMIDGWVYSLECWPILQNKASEYFYCYQIENWTIILLWPFLLPLLEDIHFTKSKFQVVCVCDGRLWLLWLVSKCNFALHQSN